MTSSIPSRVRLIDVGPRDGLQNEKTPVPAAVKVELVHRLQASCCSVLLLLGPNSRC